MQTALERTKWSLWHGKPKQAYRRFREVEWRIGNSVARYPKFSALARAVNEFLRYIDRNASIIPDLWRPLACWSGHLHGFHRVVGELPLGQALR